MTQDATNTALAFYYQGCYALVALLRCADDDAGVAVETHDDVVLDTNSLKTLSQLKHKAAPLSIKSDDFWKAVANWIAHRSDPSIRFRFVLTSRLAHDSILRRLSEPTDYPAVCAALQKEAARVVATAANDSDATSFKRRLDGCRAFLALTDFQRMDLVQRLDVQDETFSVGQYEAAVAEQLTQTPRNTRTKVSERLIGWWDRQIALALSTKRSRVLRRAEVLEMIASTTQLLFSDRLPDDFANRQASNSLDETPMLVRQIKLIDGSPFWITEAKQERWRARGQRDSWLAEELSVVERLEDFDKGLIREWRLRFEPIALSPANDQPAEKRWDENCSTGRSPMPGERFHPYIPNGRPLISYAVRTRNSPTVALLVGIRSMQHCSTGKRNQAMRDDVALDIYALTNPAFWALVLTQFINGYQVSARDGKTEACPYPLLFLPMPLVFSHDALARFQSTNRNTGLVTWLERHPIVRATVAPEIRAAKPYTRRALTFALAACSSRPMDGAMPPRARAGGRNLLGLRLATLRRRRP